MEEPDKQEKKRDSNGRWVKGVSGNIMGRPKGKTMKEWSKEYLSRLTDEERDEFMDGMPKEIIWKMAEGNPKQDVEGDLNLNVSKIISVDEQMKKGEIKSNSYKAIHIWLVRYFKHPDKCEKCGLKGEMMGRRWSIEWALRKGFNYERNIDNYQPLCKSCHRTQDWNTTISTRIWATRRLRYGKSGAKIYA